MLYQFELEDDNFEILEFDDDEKAIEEALEREEVFNVIKIDDDYNAIETIF